jgi:hypothetical protein
MLEAISDFLGKLHEYHIVIFPYFLGLVGLAIVFIIRKTPFINRYGLQIIAIIILVPAILVGWERKWISSDAGAAILSGIAVYAFGLSGREQRPQQPDAPKSN